MTSPIVFMYSGQGAQYYHMGKQLFETDDTFSTWFRRCDEIVAPQIGASLEDLIYRERNDKYAPFERTLYTHPAIVAFSYSLTKCVMARGIQPDILLGYSLGECICAIIAGATSLENGLTMIVNQAKALESDTEPAGMMAVLHHPGIMEHRPDLFSGTWLAGHNFDGHFVVTGRRPALEKIEQALRNDGITTQILPVTHGFHSPLVAPIEAQCKAVNDLAPFKIPVVSTFNKGRLHALTGDHIYNVLRNPVLFYETVQTLEAGNSYTYIDLGPAGTLSTFIKYALPPDSRSLALTCVNQFGRDRITMDKMFTAVGKA